MKYINSEGSFDCIVNEPTAGWFGESGQKETPFIRVPVVVTDEGPEKGSGAVWQGWLSAGAFENTVKRLTEVFGFNGDLAGLATGRQTFAGKPCSITTEFEDYEGKRRCKIKWLNAPGGGESAKPMEQRKLDALLARLTPQAIKVAKMAGNGVAAGAAAAEKAIEPRGEDDVPF